MSVTQIIDKLNKQFGKDTVAGNIPELMGVIPTGSIALDNAIGVGGYPLQRITELFGSDGVGKSSLCMHAIANAQKLGYVAAYIDAESTFHPGYAEAIGVDMDKDKFLLIQAETSEDYLAIIEVLMQEKEIGLVILDSVGVMVPTKESVGQGEMGDSHVGLIARNMAQFTRRVTPLLRNTNAALLMVNQVRETISASAYAGKTTPGGHAFRHACSLRIQLSRRSVNKDDDDTSINVIAEIKKNKLARSFHSAEFIIVGGKGIDTKYEICKLLLESGIIVKSGSWYKNADGASIGQGITSVYGWLDAHDDIVKSVLELANASPIYAT